MKIKVFGLGNRISNVEEFIVEIEGSPQHPELTRWGQFTDIKDIKKVSGMTSA